MEEITKIKMIARYLHEAAQAADRIVAVMEREDGTQEEAEEALGAFAVKMMRLNSVS